MDGAMDRQVKHLLHQFEDVFRSPVGLPREKDIAHGVDLETGASLPTSGLYRRSGMDDEEIAHSLHQFTKVKRAFEWGTYQ